MQLLRKIPGSEGKERLFVFHHAGGNGNQYVQHLRNFKTKFEIYVLDLPGRNFRINEPSISSMSFVLETLFQEIRALPPKPAYFFGHSMGGIIAFELCRLIARENLFQIRKLGISAAKTPLEKPKIGSSLTDKDLVSHLEEYSQLPSVISSQPELLSAFLLVIRSDYQLIESYQCTSTEKLNVKAFVFGGSEDKIVLPADLNTWTNWLSLSAPPVLFHGDHFYLFNHFHKVIETLTEG